MDTHSPTDTKIEASVADADAILGGHLRHLRQGRKMSLQDVAARTGLSIGFISQIERGLSSPTIKTLRQIADALEIPLASLFQEVGGPQPGTPAWVVRADARHYMGPWRPGISDQLLSPASETDVEMMLFRLEPFAASGTGPYTHQGEEVGIVMEGQLELTVDGECALLSAGDSFGFRSTRPHWFRNPTDSPTVVLWVNVGNNRYL